MKVEIKIRKNGAWENPTLQQIGKHSLLDFCRALELEESIVKVETKYGDVYLCGDGPWLSKLREQGRLAFSLSEILLAFNLPPIMFDMGKVFPEATVEFQESLLLN